MDDGLSTTICQTIAATRFADLPVGAVTAAKHVLLDASAVMLAASGLSAEAQPFIRLAKAGGPGPSTILGTGFSAQPGLAALANGAMAHALDYEDAFDPAPGHPNASLVPALIALAQSEGPVDGRRFLTALALGGDLSCRIGLSLRQPMEAGGWYPPPMIAALGAVTGAAHMLGLDADRMRDALSLMLCQTVTPGEIKYSATTVLRAVREGFPAQAAVTSALLARDGVTGFEAPLEGRAGFYALYAGGQFDADTLLGGLGSRFWGEQLTFKPWPSCRGTHPFIEMALDVRRRHTFAPENITAIIPQVDDVQQMLAEPLPRKQAPAVLIDAKFSIPFTIAIALLRGKVGLDEFTEDTLRDPAILAMAARVTPERAENPGWQRGSGGALRIVLNDGTHREARLDNALGCPARPLSEADLVDKFIDCVTRAAVPIDKIQATALAARILSLEDCADAGAVFSPMIALA